MEDALLVADWPISLLDPYLVPGNDCLQTSVMCHESTVAKEVLPDRFSGQPSRVTPEHHSVTLICENTLFTCRSWQDGDRARSTSENK